MTVANTFKACSVRSRKILFLRVFLKQRRDKLLGPRFQRTPTEPILLLSGRRLQRHSSRVPLHILRRRRRASNVICKRAYLYLLSSVPCPYSSFKICNEQNGTFPDTNLSNCTFMESDIEYCQSKGKLVTLSLGGADSVVGFTNASQAEDFADTIWNSFLGGSSDVRPFGKAVLDG